MTEPKTATAAEEPKSQTFNLKPIETEMLVIIQNNQQAIFAVILSMIAQERLGYKVTENTQFKLSPKLDSMEMVELAPPAAAPTPTVPVNNPPTNQTPPEPPKSGVVEAK